MANDELTKLNESLQNSNSDLRMNNSKSKSELSNLRQLHTQLAQAYNEVSDRNRVLQAKVGSLQDTSTSFIRPRARAASGKSPLPAPISTSKEV